MFHILARIEHKVDEMAKELDDLKAAIDKLTAAVAVVAARAVPTPGIDPAAVEAAASKISALSDQLSPPAPSPVEAPAAPAVATVS